MVPTTPLLLREFVLSLKRLHEPLSTILAVFFLLLLTRWGNARVGFAAPREVGVTTYYCCKKVPPET